LDLASPTPALPQLDPQIALAAALAKSRGKDYPAPNVDPKLKVDYVNKLHGLGEGDAVARYRQSTHNLLYYGGRQWIDWTKSEPHVQRHSQPVGRAALHS